jgi:integrase
VRVRLKGINKVSKALADGSRVTYHYAWKGGPRLEGAPGSPEFVASYNAAHAAKVESSDTGVLRTVIDAYLDSAKFRAKADRTQKDYKKIAEKLTAEFGDMPIGALAERATRGVFRAWRDEWSKRSKRQADYGWTVLALILAWGKEGGLVDANPCEKGGRLYDGTRADKVWSDADEEAFLRVCSPEMRLAITLALWTGQRQGDLLKLRWVDYDGTDIRLRQSKTGVRVTVPVGGPLKAMLDALPRVAATIMVSSDKRPWTEDSFRVAWGRAATKAEIVDRTFHDLRGTAVTRLFIAGCLEAEIATITGHALKDVRSILDAHYFHRDRVLAESGIRKYEKSRGASGKAPN